MTATNEGQPDRLANPETVAGFRIGDAVRLPSIACTLQVIGLDDPLLILRAPSGRELRAGWRAVTRIRTMENTQ